MKKRKLTSLAAGMMALALVVGSWAFYHNEAAIENNLNTKSYGNKTVEEFTPDQSIEPGDEVTKAVGVTNTGDYDLVVRIKMDETWSRGGAAFVTLPSSNAGFNTVSKVGTTYTASQGNPTDGLVTGDQSVMYKNMDLTKWTFNAADGYWYYNTKLAPSASTGDLLKSLVFADNADIGVYTTTPSWSTVSKTLPALVAAQTARDTAAATYAATPNATNKAALDAAEATLDGLYGWTTTQPTDTSTITFVKSDNVIDPARGGYADADYKLTITTEVCQATTDAVDGTWTGVPAAIKTGWGL